MVGRRDRRAVDPRRRPVAERRAQQRIEQLRRHDRRAGERRSINIAAVVRAAQLGIDLGGDLRSVDEKARGVRLEIAECGEDLRRGRRAGRRGDPLQRHRVQHVAGHLRKSEEDDERYASAEQFAEALLAIVREPAARTRWLSGRWRMKPSQCGVRMFQ
jgi:hypothetical protein